MPAPQNFKNHTRFDPPFHFFILPMLLANLVIAVMRTVHEWPANRSGKLWWVAISIALVLLGLRTRIYALTVQNRVIRLEERLRFAALLPTAELPATEALSIRQIVALRFASDAELPALIQRTLAEKLEPKQIKQSIQVWRPDYERV